MNQFKPRPLYEILRHFHVSLTLTFLEAFVGDFLQNYYDWE